MTLPRKIRAFWTHFSWREKLIVPFVFIALGVARLTVLTVPFRRYAFIFGQTVDANSIQSSNDSFTKSSDKGRVIRLVAKNTPWTSNCLAQAIVAAVYLRLYRVPFTVYFGVKTSDKTDADLDAHAWVMSGGEGVTGLRASIGMTSVSAFIFIPMTQTPRA